MNAVFEKIIAIGIMPVIAKLESEEDIKNMEKLIDMLEDSDDVQHLGIFDGLLHPGSDTVSVILCLDDSQRNIGLVVKQIVCALSLSPGCDISADDDTTVREVVLHFNLLKFIPACALNRWSNIL